MGYVIYSSFISEIRIIIRRASEVEAERCIFLKCRIFINDCFEWLTLWLNIIDDCSGFHSEAYLILISHSMTSQMYIKTESLSRYGTCLTKSFIIASLAWKVYLSSHWICWKSLKKNSSDKKQNYMHDIFNRRNTSKQTRFVERTRVLYHDNALAPSGIIENEFPTKNLINLIEQAPYHLYIENNNWNTDHIVDCSSKSDMNEYRLLTS